MPVVYHLVHQAARLLSHGRPTYQDGSCYPFHLPGLSSYTPFRFTAPKITCWLQTHWGLGFCGSLNLTWFFFQRCLKIYKFHWSIYHAIVKTLKQLLHFKTFIIDYTLLQHRTRPQIVCFIPLKEHLYPFFLHCHIIPSL